MENNADEGCCKNQGTSSCTEQVNDTELQWLKLSDSDFGDIVMLVTVSP